MCGGSRAGSPPFTRRPPRPRRAGAGSRCSPRTCGRISARPLPFLERTVSGGDYLLVWDYNHDFLERRRALLEKRAREGRIRDGHGDLHAEHVCVERARVRIYDCIEFSDRLRQCDVAADIAFLYMDLLHHRRPDLATALMDEYLRRTGDWEVRLLVPFYACYRAVVREKVESLRLADPGIAAAAQAGGGSPRDELLPPRARAGATRRAAAADPRRRAAGQRQEHDRRAPWPSASARTASPRTSCARSWPGPSRASGSRPRSAPGSTAPG